jgi:hypothetical protein
MKYVTFSFGWLNRDLNDLTSSIGMIDLSCEKPNA